MKLAILESNTLTVNGHAIPIRTEKGGAVTFCTQKEMGSITGLKGAALKRAHSDYRFKLGVRGNQNIAAQLAGGQIVLQKWKATESGDFIARFTTPEKIGVSSVSPIDAAAALPIDQLAALLIKRQEEEKAKAAASTN